MAIGKDGTSLRPLGALFQVGTFGNLTDGQLLERFATGRGETGELAFSVLVERHGPMVLRVCRGLLPDPNDADDAFQATFLVLVTRARGLWVRDSLGPWLHQVAHRTAKCARRSKARRQRLELSTVAGPRREADERHQWLHEEIERLPERYRAPLVLCDLEGRTHEQAARHLGWPIGTVKSRQSRGRERLRERMSRRGKASSGGLLFGGMKTQVSPSLMEATTRAAVRSSAGSFIPGSVAVLTREVSRMMSFTRGWKAATVLLALGATVSGAAVFGQKDERKADDPVKDDRPTLTVKSGKFRATLTERGSLEAARASRGRSEVEGMSTIISIVPEGTAVLANDLVCELDSTALRDQLVNQEIAVKKAQRSYETAQLAHQAAGTAVQESDETLGEQKKSLEAAVTASESAIKNVETRRERTLKAQQRLEAILQTKTAGQMTAADILAELDIRDRLDEIEQIAWRAKADLESARKKLEILANLTTARKNQELTANRQGAESALGLAKAHWDLEKAREAKIRKLIGKCKIHAPIAGVVYYANSPANRPGRPQIEEGATVRERQILFEILDVTGPMKLNTKVHESIVDRVKPGQTASITVDAMPNHDFAGLVEKVQPLPDPTAFGDNRKLYTTFVGIKDGSPKLRPGMTAKVEIVTTELDDVISIPNHALRSVDGKYLVDVKKSDGTFEPREVKLGAANGRDVVIKEGLKEGDTIVVPRSEKDIKAANLKALQRIRDGQSKKDTPPGPPAP